jgi:hypothetical protein
MFGYNDGMVDQTSPNGHLRIDASELNHVEITHGGQRICLRVRDGAGRAASVSLPIECLNTVLTAVPRTDKDLLAGAADQVYRVDSWSLGQDEAGLVLNLHLPDGTKIAFGMKPWQLVAMASLAGASPSPGRARLH